MPKQNEVIEVLHETGDERHTDINAKVFEFEYNGYWISVYIAGQGHYFKGIWVEIRHDKFNDGFKIKVEPKNGELKLSIDHDGGMTETEHRSYKEWIKLEQIEAALKIIGAVIK